MDPALSRGMTAVGAAFRPRIDPCSPHVDPRSLKAAPTTEIP